MEMRNQVHILYYLTCSLLEDPSELQNPIESKMFVMEAMLQVDFVHEQVIDTHSKELFSIILTAWMNQKWRNIRLFIFVTDSDKCSNGLSNLRVWLHNEECVWILESQGFSVAVIEGEEQVNDVKSTTRDQSPFLCMWTNCHQDTVTRTLLLKSLLCHGWSQSSKGSRLAFKPMQWDTFLTSKGKRGLVVMTKPFDESTGFSLLFTDMVFGGCKSLTIFYVTEQLMTGDCSVHWFEGFGLQAKKRGDWYEEEE